ncbi:MAG TPA: restriction endonuclease, partial [Firmicutes bacterium]|nr:restriction endonuclease [Bacillota bacterium]
ILTERIYSLYNAYKNSEKDIYRSKLEVLKVISKHECFQERNDEAFEKWLANILVTLGYTHPRIDSTQSGDGKDASCLDEKGNRVYVQCKLRQPENFEKESDRPDLQKLVGAMLVDGVKKGLVLTASTFTAEARNYAKKLPRGYELILVDGDELMEKLYRIRKLQLEPLLKPLKAD